MKNPISRMSRRERLYLITCAIVLFFNPFLSTLDQQLGIVWFMQNLFVERHDAIMAAGVGLSGHTQQICRKTGGQQCA